MATHPDVLVVGGGVIGLTSAYLLAKSGLRVEVVDKGEMGREASWAGAGILPPWGDGDYATPLDRLRAWSVSRFAAFSAELRERTGIDNEYHVCGGVEFLGADNADRPDLWRREGVRFERYDGVRPTSTVGYRLPYAQVRNPRHLKVMVEACRRAGVKLSPNTPVRGFLSTGRWHEARTQDGRSIAAGRFLITAGAWADRAIDGIGRPLGVVPVRGQMVLFNPPRPVLQEIVVVGKRYVVPRRDGRILAGSTEEPEAGYDRGITSDAREELVRFACSLVPGLRGSVDFEKCWSGLRPGSPDGLPFIGVWPTVGDDNSGSVWAATGHFRAGIQLSLGTAECILASMWGKPPPVPLDAFAVGRTPHPPMRHAFRS